MNFKIFFLGLFIIVSCSPDKNKPYENVNIIRDEKEKKSKVKPELKLPAFYAKSSMLIIELSQSNLEILSWDKDSIYINKTFPELGNSDLEVYQGNNQVIIREKSVEKKNQGNTWKVSVPKFTDLNIKSQNGTVIIKNVNGTFNINSPVGDVQIIDCSAAIQVLSQSGNISVDSWHQMGRSKFSAASGKINIKAEESLAYQMSAHSGSDSLIIDLNGNSLKINLELLTFQGEGHVYSEYKTSKVEEFYSDALNRNYDLRKIEVNSTFPTSSISTGNGTILILK